MKIYLDMETYFDDEYTLSKMSSEEYIRDPRFEAMCLAVAIDDSPVMVFPPEKIAAVINALPLDRKDVYTYAHNMGFDGFIVTHIYQKYISNPVNVQALGRWTGVSRLTGESQAAFCEFLGTGEKWVNATTSMKGRHWADMNGEERRFYLDYNISDVDMMRKNVKLMEVPDKVLRFIAMSKRMYTTPVLTLDKMILRAYESKLLEEQVRAQEDLAHLFKFNTVDDFLTAIRSKDALVKMFEQLGAEVPYKMSEKKTATARANPEKELKRLAKLGVTGEAYDEAAGQLATGTYEIWEPAFAKTDKGFMDLLDHENEDIATLARLRAEHNSSNKMSRCATFLAIADRGLLPVALEPFRAWTGRYTAGGKNEAARSDRTNLQNLAKRGTDLTLREAIKAPPGFSITAADSSQVEARVLAFLSNQVDLVQAFAAGEDPYCQLAETIYNEPTDTIYYYAKGPGGDKKSPEYNEELHDKYDGYRFIGKTGILQLGYSSSGAKLAQFLLQNRKMLKYTDSDGTIHEGEDAHKQECLRIVRVYRNKYQNIPKFWKICTGVLQELCYGQTVGVERSGYFGGPDGKHLFYHSHHDVYGRKVPGIMMPNGYWLLYPGLREEVDEHGKAQFVYDQKSYGKTQVKKIYGGLLCENITQCYSFQILWEQAIEIDEYYPVITNIHDAWAVIHPDSETEKAQAILMREMRRCPVWATGVPIDCEVKTGKDFRHV